jgi:hypothetical protein
VRDVIGTAVLGILAGHWRYAHLTALVACVNISFWPSARMMRGDSPAM